VGRLRLVGRRSLARTAAPVAFLLAATIAVLLVRSGLNESDGPAQPAREVATVETRPAPRAGGARFYRVRAGDTLDLIAVEHETTVERLLRLNKGIEPTNLQPGDRIRLR
jgi:LysM repeat protein